MSEETQPPTYPSKAIVLAKVKGYPPWPAMVLDQDLLPDHIKAKKPKSVKQPKTSAKNNKRVQALPVRFFCDDTYIWIKDSDIKELTSSMITEFLAKESTKNRKDKLLLVAYELANNPPDMELFIKYGSKGEPEPEPEPEPEAEVEDEEEEGDDDDDDEEEEEEEGDGQPAKKKQRVTGALSRKKPGPKPGSSRPIGSAKPGPKPGSSRPLGSAKPGPKPKAGTKDSKAGTKAGTKAGAKAGAKTGTAKGGSKAKGGSAAVQSKLGTQPTAKAVIPDDPYDGYDSDWGINDIGSDADLPVFSNQKQQREFETKFPDSQTINEQYRKQADAVQKIRDNLCQLLLLDVEHVKEAEIAKELSKLKSMKVPQSIVKVTQLNKLLIVVQRRPEEKFPYPSIRKDIAYLLKKWFDLEIRANDSDELKTPENGGSGLTSRNSVAPEVKEEKENGK